MSTSLAVSRGERTRFTRTLNYRLKQITPEGSRLLCGMTRAPESLMSVIARILPEEQNPRRERARATTAAKERCDANRVGTVRGWRR